MNTTTTAPAKKNIDREALTTKWKAKDLGLFTTLRVDTINHRPDIFCIGPQHVAHASARCGGMLGEETLERFPCAHCKRPLSEHTYDTVLMLQLTRDGTNAEASAILKPLAPEMEADGIDGLVMVETLEKFRITK